MNRNLLLLCITCVIAAAVQAQSIKVSGTITNHRMEPLAFATVQVREWRTGTTTKENGYFELQLEEGKYDLLVSMIGYKPQVITIVVRKPGYQQNIIMEPDAANNLEQVVVQVKAKDRSEEIIRQVIRHKEVIQARAGNFSARAYIKAVQEDSVRQKRRDTVPKENLDRMALAEILLTFDRSGTTIKEERLGVTKRGNIDGLFFLSLTEGDFNFYNNLVKVPAVSATPFLSPVSYSGLLAYRFKLLKTAVVNGHKQFIIQVKPRQVSNATVEGELTVADSLWTIVQTRFRFPAYHLPEYDFFEVAQRYDTTGLITWQRFDYFSKTNRQKKSGTTTVSFAQFELNKQFPKNHFGTEISATFKDAYEKDSSFWQQHRTEPLTAKEIRFIHYKDSIYRATHTKAYLDSVDRVINKVTWKKLLYQGQQISNHEKQQVWYLPTIPSLYQPVQFGGSRVMLMLQYSKTQASKKTWWVSQNISYGIRNKDINGSIFVRRRYNPFNQGFVTFTAGREFNLIFRGDAWINLLKRSNMYLNNAIGVGHELELVNGLKLHSDIDFAFRRSLSRYKTNDLVDSLLGDVLDNNTAIAFEPYNAAYGKLRLQYTPFQRYIREPNEKIILGSSWPTVYATWRKGLPGLIKSEVDFDYLEFGIEQEIKAGIMGIAKYNVKTGSFINTKDLRLVDYQFQRRGDPFLFMNPHEAFQSLDSTFAVFKRFYQGHFVHEFNGALINKIPIVKKLQLREIAGAGFLIAPERKLQYVEGFAGLERVFKWPFNPLTKFKIGAYIVTSAANQYRNPVQFKIGITSWDKRNNKWY